MRGSGDRASGGGHGVSEADEWAHPKPFRVRLADGRAWQGAEFADGFVCIHHPDEANICTIAISIDGLLNDQPVGHPLRDAHVERPT